jgi:hypothetical protein
MENVERKDLSLWERLRNLEKILLAFADDKGMTFEDITPTDLGRLLGCSLPHAMNYIAVLRAGEAVKTLVRDNKLKNLEKAALIAQIKSDAVMKEAVDACEQGATFKKLKLIAAQDKPKKSNVIRTSFASPNTRGRQSTLVNLGTTRKVQVAKLIIDSVLNHEKVTHLKQHFIDLNWADYKSINHAFRQLLRTLEQIEA